jgi:hypothetical protein
VIIRGTHPDNVGTGGKQLSEKLNRWLNGRDNRWKYL